MITREGNSVNGIFQFWEVRPVTVGYFMERLREVRAVPFDAAAVYDELSRVESMVSEEVQGCGAVRLLPGADDETELLVHPPYDGMYLHYLCAKIDQAVQEYDSANTEMTVFSGLYDEYAKWYRREHIPARGAKVKRYV